MDTSTAARRELAAKLRRLRLEARVSARLLAQRTGFSPSKISKIEHGRVAPSAQDVGVIATALNVSAPIARSLVSESKSTGPRPMLTADAPEGATPYALVHSMQDGDHAWISPEKSQQLLLRLERAATDVRIFDPVFICGLLQTPAFTWELAQRLPIEPAERHAFVAARLDRQAYAFGAGKFSCLLTQNVLTSGQFANRTMCHQLDELIDRIRFSTVAIGIITDHPDSVPFYGTNFMMFDGEAVQIDGTSRVTFATNKEFVAYHRNLMDDMTAQAVWGEEAIPVIEDTRDRLLGVASADIDIRSEEILQ